MDEKVDNYVVVHRLGKKLKPLNFTRRCTAKLNHCKHADDDA